MLSNASTIEEVLLSSPETRSALAGRTVRQMGTIAPQQSQSIRDQVVDSKG